jgi:hypothetical protein
MYVLQVGWHGAKGRRGGGQSLLVKDPMDGNHVTSPFTLRNTDVQSSLVFHLHAALLTFMRIDAQTALATLQRNFQDDRCQRIVLFNTATKDWYRFT